ncbi:MAG: hypothetical protein HOG95_09740 [Rhodospirillaceae bacterium]|jgi:hypothetical protein|nr:hypothetical protein [Rhodospirillaceae bacterium]MBT7265333.1 hypothetical protein [Rhodospirillaceae bacterium]
MNTQKINKIESEAPVFFGPFIGEFGWELMCWQGWVRRVCEKYYSDRKVIVSSQKEHSALYPYADEFWPLPSWFTDLDRAANQYSTFGWRNGWPGNVQWHPEMTKIFVDGTIETEYVYEQVHTPLNLPDMQPVAETMLNEFKARLPGNAVFMVPWKLTTCPISGHEFGIRTLENPLVNGVDFEVIEIPIEFQNLQRLSPTPKGNELLNQHAGSRGEKKFIAVHPRYCESEPTKNWDETIYVEIILRLQKLFPSHHVFVFGSLEGTCLNTIPDGCIDLINIDEQDRLEVQIAALNNSWLTIGAASGGLQLAYMTGCAVITGDVGFNGRRECEFLNVPMFNTTDGESDVEEIIELATQFASEYPN